ncbi:exonuclease SbcCD subunit D [Aeromicrobium sp. CFBP 8757]|uniref:exonuclease SbcCD subunit D n=1 Tax=Aeromicrobium sp. CFBP 8757 TaxID=2775288 RepID=UPI0017835E72|nr:exonuclease SbcCD subunit D [Aeromicrobium sp. CFBP 8757]MBD8606099.1 exonuclease SbcCD subunit D [Aeromicrobium sp. CFBP 8757]
MRILHTSDWHVGRTFHGHSTLAALDEVVEAMARVVHERDVDVVVVAGDVYDSSTPSADAVDLLNSVLLRLRDAGATVVLTSGNHDSPARLGTMSAFAAAAGVHVVTNPAQITQPVTLDDEHGPVHVYGIPFLEPARLRHVWSDAPMRSQKDVLTRAMQLVRADLAERGGRSVVLAHTFVQGVEGESCDSERDIVGTTVGGVDKVPVPVLDGVDYAALGHIHGRAHLSPHVRYSGAPLHYSFSEAGKPRGGWLVDLDAAGLADVTWVDLPVPRPLTVVTGTIDDLLSDGSLDGVTDHWVSAVLTDRTRPMDAMRRLQSRFPHCAHLEFRPSRVHDDGGRSYAELVRGKSDDELVDTFLTKVRNGEGSTEPEVDLVRDVIAEHEARSSA